MGSSIRLLTLLLCSAFLFSVNAQKKQLVRLAVIEVDSSRLDSYNQFLKEEIEASIRIEPGVLTLYAVAEKDRPSHVVLFETYADSTQYRAHLATPHFQKYKTETLNMVKGLQLIETEPIIYERKTGLAAESKDLFIRLTELEVHASKLNSFRELVKKVMEPGLKEEQGVLMMYGVAQKSDPTHITILEIYGSEKDYQVHFKTAHFLRYKIESKDMVKSQTVVDLVPIHLGAKPTHKK
jgi:quinol monooxygenase YgiN